MIARIRRGRSASQHVDGHPCSARVLARASSPQPRKLGSTSAQSTGTGRQQLQLHDVKQCGAGRARTETRSCGPCASVRQGAYCGGRPDGRKGFPSARCELRLRRIYRANSAAGGASRPRLSRVRQCGACLARRSCRACRRACMGSAGRRRTGTAPAGGGCRRPAAGPSRHRPPEGAVRGQRRSRQKGAAPRHRARRTGCCREITGGAGGGLAVGAGRWPRSPLVDHVPRG